MIVEDRHAPKAAKPLPVTEEETDNFEEAKQLIVDHPLATAAGAFAIGALLGLLRPNSRGGILRTAIGGLAMTFAREALLKKVAGYAGSWIDQRSREEAVSRQRETEAFLEH